MTVPCLVEIDGVPYTPKEPYVFRACPRAGDLIALPDEVTPGYTTRHIVRSVLHVPDGVDNNLPAFTVLFVHGSSSHA